MAFNPNDHTLAQHFDKLNMKTESKYDEEILDEAIVNGMKGEHRAFCLKIENMLNQYMAGQKVPEVIPGLDKYQRKIVHKICDLYNIKREYVDVKTDETGSITITKSETSFMPTMSLEERYQKHLEKVKKQAPTQSSNPFANKKVLIKTRSSQPDKKSASEKDDKKNDADQSSHGSKSETHDEVEHKKKKDYEEARDRIMQGNEEKHIVVENPDPNNQNKGGTKSKKKGRFEGYDPDYDRFRSSQNANNIMSNNMGPIGLGPGMPGMGMPNMYPMPNMPMPGMGGMGGMGGMSSMPFYPMSNQPYIPFPSFPMNNPTYPPNNNPNYQQNVGPFNNYNSPPQYPSGNPQPNPGPINGPPGVSGSYYQSFPSLGRDNTAKK